MEQQEYPAVQIDKNRWRIEERVIRCLLFSGREKARHQAKKFFFPPRFPYISPVCPVY